MNWWNIRFDLPFHIGLFIFKDGAWAWSRLDSSAGTGPSPNSLFWLPSSRPAGCCSAPSEPLVAKRRTTVAISRIINRRRPELQNLAVLSIIHHRPRQTSIVSRLFSTPVSNSVNNYLIDSLLLKFSHFIYFFSIDYNTSEQKQACKKHELYVSFRDLGWQVTQN